MFSRVRWAVLLLCLAISVQAQNLEQKLDEYLRACVEVHQFQGSVLVAHAGKVVLTKGYGPADIGTGALNTEATTHLIGSVTKQFTAAAIMQLVEQGKLDLEAPFTTYLTDYPKAAVEKVTVHHLLTHTSGIPSYTDLMGVDSLRYQARSAEQIVATFKDLPLEFEPGTNWKYNNSGYFLLGLIIEKLSGEPYAQYIENHVLKPAGMTHSGYFDVAHPPKHFATPHTLDSTGQHTITTRLADMSWPFAAGGLYATVGDLWRWTQALHGGKVVSATSLEKMCTPTLNSYGYGLVIDSMYGRRRVVHGGRIDGFVSVVESYPQDSTCVVILNNTDGLANSASSAALAAICFDQPYDIPVRRTPVVMDTLALDEYVGVFEIEPGMYRVISRSADTLFAMRTGGRTSQILPEEKDKFFYSYDNAIVLSFLRDAEGKIESQRIRQEGKETIAKKIFGAIADSLLQAGKTIKVDPAILATYVGEYELFPGFTLTVTVEGERIFTQGTGQPRIELHALSQEKFTVREAGAEIVFERGPEGSVGSLTLYQGGQIIPGRRIK